MFFFVQVPSGSMSSSAPLLTCERKMQSTQNVLKLWLCDGTVSSRCGMEHVRCRIHGHSRRRRALSRLHTLRRSQLDPELPRPEHSEVWLTLVNPYLALGASFEVFTNLTHDIRGIKLRPTYILNQPSAFFGTTSSWERDFCVGIQSDGRADTSEAESR